MRNHTSFLKNLLNLLAKLILFCYILFSKLNCHCVFFHCKVEQLSALSVLVYIFKIWAIYYALHTSTDSSRTRGKIPIPKKPKSMRQAKIPPINSLSRKARQRPVVILGNLGKRQHLNTALSDDFVSFG